MAGVTGIQKKLGKPFRLQCYRRCLIEDYCTGRISRRIDEDPNVPYLVLVVLYCRISTMLYDLVWSKSAIPHGHLL